MVTVLSVVAVCPKTEQDAVRSRQSVIIFFISSGLVGLVKEIKAVLLSLYAPEAVLLLSAHLGILLKQLSVKLLQRLLYGAHLLRLQRNFRRLRRVGFPNTAQVKYSEEQERRYQAHEEYVPRVPEIYSC